MPAGFFVRRLCGVVARSADKGVMHTSADIHHALRGKRITVMGLGRFGGGIGVTRFLAGQGAKVLVTDQETPENLAASVAKIADLADAGQVELRLGEHRLADFEAADLVVASPAVKPDSAFLAAAHKAGVPVTSEIRLLASRLPNCRRIIAITGSAGKSTTTALVGHALEKLCAGSPAHVWVGGNIGGSLLERVADVTAQDWVVLELSSFMLEGLREDRFAPGIAVVTNFAPNHLDWHPTLADYGAAKKAIFQAQQPGDTLFLGPGLDDWIAQVPAGVKIGRPVHDAAVWAAWEAALPAGTTFRLPGLHNRQNARVAVAVGEAAGFAPQAFFAACCGFGGLPHRLQFVAEKRGVAWYNDSKSTTPEATCLAVDAFPAGSVHVVVGGKDKGSDLAAMAAHLAHKARTVYTVGAMGDQVAQQVGARGGCQVVRCGTVANAVLEVAARAKAGEVGVLSPAFASWDQFPNYEARGECFIQAVSLL